MKKNFRVTIFTATYNRADTLRRLYDSIVIQKYDNLEWLIVDDGSSDNTQAIIEKLINQKVISINYIKQVNGGKHRAINRGLKEATGELFYVVDSDDYLTPDSLLRTLFYWDGIADDPEFAGVVGFMCYADGTKHGGGMPSQTLDSNLIERRSKYNIQGDLAKVIKTKVFRKFPFPDIPGEYFVAESLVWNRMAENYKFRYFDESIYVFKYLSDGLSYNSIRNRRKNPRYACMLYSELANNSKAAFGYKAKAIVNFWRFSFNIKSSFWNKVRQVKNVPLSLFLLPLGFLMYIKDGINANVKPGT